MYSRSLHVGLKNAWPANIKGRFIETTRQYSGLKRAAPGTERYRLTELHRRFNRTWIVLLCPCSPSEREGKETQTKGNALCCLSPLSCWCTAYCPEVRNTVHMPIPHLNCLCSGTEGSLWVDWADVVAEMKWFRVEHVCQEVLSCCCCCCF